MKRLLCAIAILVGLSTYAHAAPIASSVYAGLNSSFDSPTFGYYYTVTRSGQAEFIEATEEWLTIFVFDEEDFEWNMIYTNIPLKYQDMIPVPDAFPFTIDGVLIFG